MGCNCGGNGNVGYKIVEIKDGQPFLFHPNHGNRKIPMDVWVMAEFKVVRDRSTTYSGFHYFEDRAVAEKYFVTRFRNRKNRAVIPCMIKGVVRRKNEKTGVMLANQIFISSLDLLPFA